MTNFTNTRINVEHDSRGGYTTDVTDVDGNWTRNTYIPTYMRDGVQQYTVTSINNQINRENTLTENDQTFSTEQSYVENQYNSPTISQEEMDKIMEKYKGHNVIVALFLLMFDVTITVLKAFFSLFTMKVK